MRLTSFLRALAASAALVLIGCGDEPSFDIELVASPQSRCDGLDIIEPTDVVELRVTGPDMSDVVVETKGDSGGIDLPSIPDGKNRVVDVKVWSTSGGTKLTVRAVGRSAPFEVKAGSTKSVRIGLYRTNYFGEVIGPEGKSGCSKMLQQRAGHASAVLPNGTVLIAGGFTSLENLAPTGFLDSVEIFDPASGVFRQGPKMPRPRANAQVATLQNGDVLLVGGETEDRGVLVPIADAVLFDAKRKTWQTIPMSTARKGHTATYLQRVGHVVVVGGVDEEDQIVDTIEYFDTVTRSFVPVDLPGGSQAFGMAYHAAAGVFGVQGGKSVVVLVGGVDQEGKVKDQVSLLVWDPNAEEYQAQPNAYRMELGVAKATAMILGSSGDRLVVAGGARTFASTPGSPGAGTFSEPTDDVQWFEATSGQSRGTTKMTGGRAFDSCGLAINSTKGLIAGGSSSGRGPAPIGELLTYMSVSGTVTASKAGESDGSMQPRHFVSCTDMGPRGVLVTGGLNQTSQATTDAVIYVTMPEPRN